MPPTSTAKRRSSRISGKQTVESDMNVDSDRRPVKGKPTKNVNNKSKLPNTSEPKNSSLHKTLKVTRSSRFNAKSLKSAVMTAPESLRAPTSTRRSAANTLNATKTTNFKPAENNVAQSAENEETSKINAALTVTRKTRAVKRSTINSNKATVLTTVTRSSRNRSSDNSDSDQDPVETVPTSSTRRSSSNNLKNSLKARRAKPPKPYRESSENDEVTDNEPVTAKPRKRSRSRSKPSTKVTRSSRPNAAVNQNLTFIDSLKPSEQDPKPVSTSVTRCASQHLDSDPHSSEDKDANDGDSSTVYTSSTSEYEASEDPSSDSSGFTDARDSHYDETEKKPKPVFKASTTPKFKFFSIPKGDAKPGPSRPRQPKPPKKAKKQVHESDDEISDWEDVEDSPPRKRRLNPEDIQVTVIKSEEQKKNETLEAELKAERSKRRRLLCKSVHEFFIYGHVAHLHCYLKHLLSDDSDFLNVCLEAIPVNVQLKKSLKNLEAFLKWFKATFTKAKDSVKERAENRKKLTETMELLLRKQAYVTNRDMCTLLFSFLVSLKFTARLGLALAITSEDAILEWIDAGKKKSLPEIPIDQNYFVEVWNPSGKKWISLDPIRTSWSEPFKTAEAFTEGFNYVVAIDNEYGVREVTPRYTENYLTYAYRKTRPGADFLKELLIQTPFSADKTRTDLEEAFFENELASRGLPTAAIDFKNHPLYALKKQLLKFEAIYPRDQEPICVFSNSNVYPRESVYILQREIKWQRIGRKLKPGEQPYNVVKANPNPFLPKEVKDKMQTQEIYGIWQTEPYTYPPVGPNDPIPRNRFGDIDLYVKKTMLPKGCTYIPHHDITSMARKLKIEYAKAVIDWAFKKKRMYAVRKGIVVHDKDAERLISAWKENLLDRLRKIENKVKQRVYGNWSRLARNSLLVKKVREKVGLLRKKPIEKNQETLSDSDEEKEEQEEGIEQEQWPAAEFPLQDLHKR